MLLLSRIQQLGKRIAIRQQIGCVPIYLDGHGVMRIQGRLEHTDCLTYDARYPILLRRKFWVSLLIVCHYHEAAGHVMEVNFVLTSVMAKFWIIYALKMPQRHQNSVEVRFSHGLSIDQP